MLTFSSFSQAFFGIRVSVAFFQLLPQIGEKKLNPIIFMFFHISQKAQEDWMEKQASRVTAYVTYAE